MAALALHRKLAGLCLNSSAASCSRASTSSLHLQSSSFHTTAPNSEKRRKRVARLKKKANLEKREHAKEVLASTRPDPIRGYGPNNESLWKSSILCQLLLDKEKIWAGVEQAEQKQDGLLPAPSSDGSQTLEFPVYDHTGTSENDDSKDAFNALEASQDEHNHSSSTPTTIPVDESSQQQQEQQQTSASSIPARLNFGLTSEDAHLLFEQLPKASSALHYSKSRPENMLPAMRKKIEAEIEAEHKQELEKIEVLKRIVDLRNSNARGIRWENTRRILNVFGDPENTGKPSSGWPEFQAALLTMRIHNVADSLEKMPRDIHGKLGLRALVMQRANVLKYLKSRNLERYVKCLKDIGVEQRAVEGEIIIRKPVAANKQFKSSRVATS